MKATITKLITNDKQARIYILDNTDLIHELVSLENFNIISKEALSTTFTLSSLLCGLLKDKQRVSIQINTSTPSKYIRCDVDSYGNVRGMQVRI
jgi:molecular chaperone Hsp33